MSLQHGFCPALHASMSIEATVRGDQPLHSRRLCRRSARVAISDTILDANDTRPWPMQGRMVIARTAHHSAFYHPWPDTHEMTLGENSIFLGIVTSERRQQGCVRFRRRWHHAGAAVTVASHRATARRCVCVRSSPQLRYGDPGYGQLALHCAGRFAPAPTTRPKWALYIRVPTAARNQLRSTAGILQSA
jgi:hypothetical protein